MAAITIPDGHDAANYGPGILQARDFNPNDRTQTTPVPTTSNSTNLTPVVPSDNVTVIETTLPSQKHTPAIPAENVTTVPQPTESANMTKSTSNLSVFSSPVSAAVLLDGDYIGTTPVTIPDVTAGYHMLKLTLSGHYDYETKVYVIAGQDQKVFGTLHPISQIITRETPLPTTIVPTPSPVTLVPVTTTPVPGVIENPGVLAAIIGVITATIGAAATIFATVKKKNG